MNKLNQLVEDLFLSGIAIGENDFDPYIPELWAQESLMILEENTVMAALVHRDFENEIQKFGDIVNTRRPVKFTAKRKNIKDGVTIQDASADNVQVKLDQLIHTSFIVHDGDESESFQSLVDTFIRPAAMSLSTHVDRVLTAQALRFMSNQVGKLGGMTKDNAKSYVIAAREKLNDNLAPNDQRYGVLSSHAESILLDVDFFTGADTSGDGGIALREGVLGRKMGIRWFMDQNQPSFSSGSRNVLLGAVNLLAGYPAGTTTLVVDGFTGAVENDNFIVVDGQLHQVASHTETTGNTTQIVLKTGLYKAVADNAVIAAYTSAVTVDNDPAIYTAGYSKTITFVLGGAGVDVPVIGMPIAFASQTDIYTVISAEQLSSTTWSVQLDRPLVTALATSDTVAVQTGPPGGYNFVFNKNALALVSRPLALPRAGSGAASAVVNYNGLSIRVTITYQGKDHGTLVTLDMLCGVQQLDENLGVLFLS